MEKVSKENGAKHDEAQERESEPEMEVNDTPENPTEVDIGKTPDEQKKVEREVDPQVKENSKKKINEHVDTDDSNRDQNNAEENKVVGENLKSSEFSEQDNDIVIKRKTKRKKKGNVKDESIK